MNELKHLIEQTRTFRRFQQDQEITTESLHQLLDLARLGGSARNCQPWQYLTINDKKLCENIFPYLGWAGYLSDWKGPAEGERPSAYIICLLNSNWLKGPEKEAHFDLGIASQNLLLGAMKMGFGGCRIGSFSPKLGSLFPLPDHLGISLVIALGVPKERVVLEDCDSPENIRYWRDKDDTHHIPKRALRDIIFDADPL